MWLIFQGSLKLFPPPGTVVWMPPRAYYSDRNLVEQLLDAPKIEYQEIGHDQRQNLWDEDFHGIGRRCLEDHHENLDGGVDEKSGRELGRDIAVAPALPEADSTDEAGGRIDQDIRDGEAIVQARWEGKQEALSPQEERAEEGQQSKQEQNACQNLDPGG